MLVEAGPVLAGTRPALGRPALVQPGPALAGTEPALIYQRDSLSP